VRSIGEDPFAWPSDGDDWPGYQRGTPGSYAGWLESLAQPDSALFEEWHHEDTTAGEGD
jgi:hypothetical protein